MRLGTIIMICIKSFKYDFSNSIFFNKNLEIQEEKKSIDQENEIVGLQLMIYALELISS